MNSTTSSYIKENPTFIFSCSGGSDAGEIADRAARLLAKEGAGKMFCLAGIGGRVDAILNPTRKAHQILVIDGCPLQCARKTMEQAGFSDFMNIELSSFGIKKGKALPLEETITGVFEKAKIVLHQSRTNQGQ